MTGLEPGNRPIDPYLLPISNISDQDATDSFAAACIDTAATGEQYDFASLSHDISWLPSSLPERSSAESILPLHDITVHLVEVFFEIIQPHFAILHRPTFLQRLSAGSLVAEEHAPALLLAMCALTTRYTDDPRVLALDAEMLNSGDAGPENSQPAIDDRPKRSRRGRGFMRRARELIQTAIANSERPELEASTIQGPPLQLIQAMLTLSYAEIAAGALSRAHSLLATCVRMAYDKGLDQVD